MTALSEIQRVAEQFERLVSLRGVETRQFSRRGDSGANGSVWQWRPSPYRRGVEREGINGPSR